MGVLACDRNGCEHIMCDRYSYEHGYICYECFEELVATGPTTDIQTFMDTPKRQGKKEEAHARFDAVFKLRENVI